MKKLKSSEPWDRLSELPDPLIHNILGLLNMPMRNVVGTAILSKRWENLWTTMPYLHFNDYAIDRESSIRARNLVNRALKLWRGAKILEFEIDFRHQRDDLLHIDFDSWVRFAKENGVEELYLHFFHVLDDIKIEGGVFQKDVYGLPECLYSCSTLKVLSLRACALGIHGNVQWNQLKSLKIYGCYLEDDQDIDKVLSGCPQLEVFTLAILGCNDNLTIRSSSLRKLSIKKTVWYFDHEPLSDTELTICSPILETLEMSGVPYRRCSLKMSVSYLTHATLGFHNFGGSYAGYVFIRESLRQILPTIQFVENITLSNWCIKVLRRMKKKDLVLPFPSVKFLHLNVRFKKLKRIVGLLQIFPKLQRLVIEDETKLDKQHVLESLEFDAKSNLKFETKVQHVLEYLELETNLPVFFLKQLRTVEVTWAEGNCLILPFIAIVLKCASKLEKMVFQVKGIIPPTVPSIFLYLAAQTLQRMPRSSPTAQLIFREY